MKKRILAITLILVLCLTMMPMTAAAATEIPAPTNPKAALDNDVPDAYIDFTDEVVISFGTPSELRRMLAAGEISNITVQMDWSINSENDWKCYGEDEWKGPEKYGHDMRNIVQGEEVERITAFRSNYSAPANGGYEEICYGITDNGYGYLNLTDNTIYMKLRFSCTISGTIDVLYSDWTPVF